MRHRHHTLITSVIAVGLVVGAALALRAARRRPIAATAPPSPSVDRGEGPTPDVPKEE
jgi:hypothetical protein